MIAILYLLVFMAAGTLMVRLLLPRQPVLSRLWLGCSLGLLLLMWLPALFAFFLNFSITAHVCAAVTLAPLCGVCFLLRDKAHAVHPWDAEETRQLKQLLIVVIPLTILGGWLQYTHNFRVDSATGSWHVGQSTYGDLPMHTGFITGLVDSSFPPEYPFYPGHRLSYPFLTDTMSTSLYMLGLSLQAALNVPGTLMMALCYTGVMLLAREMTVGKKTIILAALLFFLNGGLGFFYDFDLAGGTESDGTLTLWSRIEAILEGYYKTPTNQPTPNNLRWSNIICDMMIPQRTFLGGLCMVLPCFYLLYTCFDPVRKPVRGSLRGEVLLGIWAGALPLIHTHSFAALAMCSFGMMVYDLIHSPARVKTLMPYLRYAALAALLALPQLFAFTFTQTFQAEGTEGAGNTFMQLQFNWVNNSGGNGMIDLFGWFYAKNIGLPFIALILALFEKNPRWRRLFAGALVIIVCAETIRFQPNEYDNNKLFYLAHLLCCMIVSEWLAEVWRRLKGMRGRAVLAALTAVLLFLSAGLTIWRECVSDYWAFNADEVAAAEYVQENVPADAVFLSGTEHLNPVVSIAGRRIVCGPDLWLYYHGFDTTERKYDIVCFFSDPAAHTDVLEKYGVSYIYIGSNERANYDIDYDWLEENLTCVFERGSVAIYRVDGDPAAVSDVTE